MLIKSYALLILAKSSQSKSQFGQVKLNILQLTLMTLAQSGMHQSRSQEVPGSISFEVNFITRIMEQWGRLCVHNCLSVCPQGRQRWEGKRVYHWSLVHVLRSLVISLS